MPRLAGALLCLLLVVGCGGGDGEPDRLTLTTPKPAKTPELRYGGSGGGGGEASATPRVTRAQRAVIRGWSDALRHGDIERAASYWRIPAIASNGGQPIRLLTRRAVRFFNETLPCGAKLESVERDQTYVLATFRLTERPGKGRCGSGVGNRARTLFLLRDGKIAQWLRATDPPSGSSS